MQTQNVSLKTKLGRVMILNKENPIPPGYHPLSPDECHWIKHQLKNRLANGLKNQDIALSSGTFSNLYAGLQIKQESDNSNSEYLAVLLPNNFSANFSNYDQITQLLKQNEFIFLPIGLVLKVALNPNAPEGFRKMLIQEGQEFKEELKKLLQTWSIVAFQTGKYDGSGYGYKFHDAYGSQCGQMFVVSVAPI